MESHPLSLINPRATIHIEYTTSAPDNIISASKCAHFVLRTLMQYDYRYLQDLPLLYFWLYFFYY